MKRIASYLSAVLGGLLAASCAINYDLKYEAEIRGVEGENRLNVEYDGLKFEVLPLPTGVGFAIINNSESDVVLDWSRSYFIEPGGNSFKALNYDTVKEDSVIALKSLDQVVVPRGALLRRFTTASTNPERYLLIRSSSFAQYMGHGGGAWSFSSMSIREGWDFPEYFPLRISADDSQLTKKLAEVSSLMQRGPSMGLGLMIVAGESEKLYRLDLDFTKISAIATRTVEEEPGVLVGRREVTHTCAKSDNWTWKDLRNPKAKSGSVPNP
jgi:hypothetical protein